MTVATNHDASDQGETPTWAWPVYAFVAWLAGILGYVARFKRIRHDHRFRPDWRDSWEDLRQSEWLRDRLIAQGVVQLLNGHPLHLDDTKIQLTAPVNYGGPCPRTPFDMNRRFIALARWAADPEAITRERFKRLAARERIAANNPFAAHGSTDAALRAAAQHELVGGAASSRRPSTCHAEAQRGRKHARVLTKARGPPPHHSPLAPTSARSRV